MQHDQRQNQGSQADKYGKEQKEQFKKGPDSHPAKPDQQKHTDQHKKEEQRHQTGR